MYWNPFEKFYFYYINNNIVLVDQGATGQAGDACSILNNPSSTTYTSFTLPAAVTLISAPTFYSGFTYFSVDYTNGSSVLYKWPVTYNGATWTNANAASLVILYSNNTNKFRQLAARSDIGLYYTMTGQLGFF